MLHSFIASSLLVATLSNALTLPYKAPSNDVLLAEGLPLDQPTPLIASAPNGGEANRNGWVYTADSAQNGNGINNAQDGNDNTIWHSQWQPAAGLPHTVTIDTKGSNNIDGIRYRPRQDGSKNGNIGQHEIYLSNDGNNWGDPVAYGTWYDDQTDKYATWETRPARYVRIKCITEAGNRGPWSSATEFYIWTNSYQAPPQGVGAWGQTINFPLVPAAAAVEPDTGNVLVWSSYAYDQFSANPGGQTLTANWNFKTKVVSQRLVQNTGHDMFCPGISFTANGVIVITGGNSAARTSLYDTRNGGWVRGDDMWTQRGYAAQVTLGNGDIFTIGGSWSGGSGGKNGERYSPATGHWYQLPGANVGAMLTADAAGVYRADNHGWLFSWKDNVVFQAGPSKAMNWYTATGNGNTQGAGNRGDDGDSMCGNAVMYDAANGKIATFGGASSYSGVNAHAKAHVITLGNSNNGVNVQNINPMWFRRVFHSSVVLPDGNVFIAGGQGYGNPFSDDQAVYTPEMWNPQTTGFYKMAPNSIPRTYHSWSLLLPDATVMNGGGGLCGGCSTNHFDAQIYYPQYLLNNDGSKRGRPVINNISARNNVPGAQINVNTNGAVSAFSMIRYGSATHTVNTDQRRIPLQFTNQGNNNYKVTLGPNNYGQVVPGYWMLFALDNNGTPSVATTLFIW